MNNDEMNELCERIARRVVELKAPSIFPATGCMAKADKTSTTWQEAKRDEWRVKGYMPDTLDRFEAAAYLHISDTTLRTLCHPGKDGRAQLRHQRVGALYRFKKTHLDAFGEVKDRSA